MGDLNVPTIVEVTQIPGIEEKVCSEEVTKAPLAWSEGEGGVEMETPSPVGLPSQVVTCHCKCCNQDQNSMGSTLFFCKGT